MKPSKKRTEMDTNNGMPRLSDGAYRWVMIGISILIFMVISVWGLLELAEYDRSHAVERVVDGVNN